MKGKNKLPKECNIMGHEISLLKIKNPHIRNAINSRAGFLFNYSDSSYNDGWHEITPHQDHNKYGPHRNQHLDHTEYNEHSDASDYSCGASR